VSPAESPLREARALVSQLEQLSVLLTRQANRLLAETEPEPVDTSSSRRARLLAAETERARLARELHDGPAQRFANAVIETELLERLARHKPGAVIEGLSALRESLQQGVVELRECLFELRAPGLDDKGLVAMIGDYVAEFERRFGFEVAVALPSQDVPLPADQALPVFRVLQEALTNARRHSGTKCVRVELCYDERALQLMVEDQGKGFSPDAARSGKHGLLGMREYAVLAGGHLEVEGRPGQGTRVVLRVPLW
jgi:two-component system sensor histidine kinase DegS